MDPVIPTHYSTCRIQPLDFIIANKLDFLEGNIIKYICRYRDKGGLKDLRKAQTYLERLITQTEQELTPCVNGTTLV